MYRCLLHFMILKRSKTYNLCNLLKCYQVSIWKRYRHRKHLWSPGTKTSQYALQVYNVCVEITFHLAIIYRENALYHVFINWNIDSDHVSYSLSPLSQKRIASSIQKEIEKGFPTVCPISAKEVNSEINVCIPRTNCQFSLSMAQLFSLSLLPHIWNSKREGELRPSWSSCEMRGFKII